MERIKIDLPEKFNFQTEIQVCTGDINYGGHLGYDSMLTLMQEARIRFLKKHGFTELDAGGPGLLVRDAAVIYKKEVFHGQVLKFEIEAVDFRKKSFDFVYRITEASSGIEAARARTGMVFFDYAGRKSAGVPDSFRRKAGGAGRSP